jgi:chaperonin cofactor prefoldin
MLFPARHRFHPRTQQDRDGHRREAALRAQLADLEKRIQSLEKEQQIQLTRIAELQLQLDKATKAR